MTIPVNFVAPNLPVALKEYDQSAHDQLRNILRLYFNQNDNHNNTVNEQVSTNQALIWMNM